VETMEQVRPAIAAQSRSTRTARVAATREQIALQLSVRLRGLTPQQAQELAGLARERSFAAGEVIFNEGDQASEIYLLLEGRVFLGAKFSESAGHVTFASIGPSEFLGWSALVHPHRKTAYAEAVADTEVLVFRSRELLDLCDQDPAMGYVIMRCLLATVGQRLIATRQRMLDIFG